MHRHTMFMRAVKAPPRQVTIGRRGYRMTAGDEAVAEDPEILTWLARVYAEKRHGSRPWPEFEESNLRGFLEAAGVNTELAIKEHTDALAEMPEVLGDPERCIPALKGASFVYPSAEGVCLRLERLRRNLRQPGSVKTRNGE